MNRSILNEKLGYNTTVPVIVMDGNRVVKIILAVVLYNHYPTNGRLEYSVAKPTGQANVSTVKNNCFILGLEYEYMLTRTHFPDGEVGDVSYGKFNKSRERATTLYSITDTRKRC